VNEYCETTRTRERSVMALGRIVASAGLALGLLAAAPAHAAECHFKAMTLPVSLIGTRAIATVEINGTPVPLMVDTGAFYSFLTDAAVQQLGLQRRNAPKGFRVEGLNSSIDIGVTTVQKLKLGAGEFANREFFVGGNNPGGGAMGILGRNLLFFTDAEFDLAHGVIRLMLPNDDCQGKAVAYWADPPTVSELSMLSDEHHVQPPVRVITQLNGHAAKAMFDTGAPSSISLSLARQAGIAEADMQAAGLMVGAGHGTLKSWIAPVQKLELGSEAVSGFRLRVVDFDLNDVDMLLGIDFFLSHRVYFAKSQHRVYFTYNGGTVFSLSTDAALQTAVSASTALQDDTQPTDAAGFARRGEALAVRRGAVHLALRQGGEAAQDFDTALHLDPAQHEARLQRAALRVGMRNRDGAVEDLQSLDQQLAPQAQERLAMAQLYRHLALPAQAIEQWDRWVPAHPHEAGLENVLSARCWARVELGTDLDKALTDCNEAIDLQSGNAAFIGNRGWVHLRRNELQDALADFNRGLGIKADAAWALYGRGVAQIKLGHADAANADIEAARRLAPSIDAEANRYGLVTGVALPATKAGAPDAAQRAATIETE